MAKTFLDQLVEYPSKVMMKIASSKECVGLLVNKSFENITEDDCDNALENNIYNYQYVNDTADEATAYVWIEADVNNVENQTIKNMRLYVTVACHKEYMKLNPSIFKGILGNRRDNLIRYIDQELNNTDIMGIGRLKLVSAKTMSPVSGFTVKELVYFVPDFNVVDIKR